MYKPTGKTTGTIAAGDDSRIVGALQTGLLYGQAFSGPPATIASATGAFQDMQCAALAVAAGAVDVAVATVGGYDRLQLGATPTGRVLVTCQWSGAVGGNVNYRLAVYRAGAVYLTSDARIQNQRASYEAICMSHVFAGLLSGDQVTIQIKAAPAQAPAMNDTYMRVEDIG